MVKTKRAGPRPRTRSFGTKPIKSKGFIYLYGHTSKLVLKVNEFYTQVKYMKTELDSHTKPFDVGIKVLNYRQWRFSIIN